MPRAAAGDGPGDVGRDLCAGLAEALGVACVDRHRKDSSASRPRPPLPPQPRAATAPARPVCRIAGTSSGRSPGPATRMHPRHAGKGQRRHPPSRSCRSHHAALVHHGRQDRCGRTENAAAAERPGQGPRRNRRAASWARSGDDRGHQNPGPRACPSSRNHPPPARPRRRLRPAPGRYRLRIPRLACIVRKRRRHSTPAGERHFGTLGCTIACLPCGSTGPTTCRRCIVRARPPARRSTLRPHPVRRRPQLPHLPSHPAAPASSRASGCRLGHHPRRLAIAVPPVPAPHWPRRPSPCREHREYVTAIAAAKASAAAVPAAAAPFAKGFAIRPARAGRACRSGPRPLPHRPVRQQLQRPVQRRDEAVDPETTPFSIASIPPISPFAAWKAKSPMAPGSLPQIATAAS